jgi:hypothetical protein
MGVLFTYEKVTRCPYFPKMFSPFKGTLLTILSHKTQEGISKTRIWQPSHSPPWQIGGGGNSGNRLRSSCERTN